MGKGGIVADIWVEDEEELTIGNIKLRFISTPGHTPGGMCILMDDIIFSGDTLFRMSVGRTDLPGGNEEDLLRSIKDKLLILPESINVFPVHVASPTATEEEKRMIEEQLTSGVFL